MNPPQLAYPPRGSYYIPFAPAPASYGNVYAAPRTGYLPYGVISPPMTMIRPVETKKTANEIKTARDAGLATTATEEYIKSKIRGIPDFPKEGILFRDITTMTADGPAFKICCEIFAKRIQQLGKIDAIGGLEARGFLFAGVASALGLPFIMFRKPNKLPGKQLSVEYGLEYGKDKLCIHEGQIKEGMKIVIVDDLVATGGTFEAGNPSFFSPFFLISPSISYSI